MVLDEAALNILRKDSKARGSHREVQGRIGDFEKRTRGGERRQGRADQVFGRRVSEAFGSRKAYKDPNQFALDMTKGDQQLANRLTRVCKSLSTNIEQIMSFEQ